MSGAGVPTVEALAAAGRGYLQPLDVQVALRLAELIGEPDGTVRLALALASRQVRLGHVCLDVRATAATPGPVDDDGLPLGEWRWPAAEAWLAAIAGSKLVCALADGAPSTAAPPEPVPLVLELPSGRLYVRRWWEHEVALAAALAERAAAAAEHDEAVLRAGLERLFPPVPGPADAGRRDQAAAAALAVRRLFAVITGGPGSGKTTTVVRLLALLAEQALAAGQAPPRVFLLAPTGKAAGRMEESVAAALARLDVEEAVRTALPAGAGTIHRALGARLDGSFRHGRAAPLPADVVVVDEASMVDLALMRALTDAVPPRARLVVLGDRDQLASVEAGAVLGEICGRAVPDTASAAQPGSGATPAAGSAPAAAAATPGAPLVAARPAAPIAGCIAHLSYSFRFHAESGIGALARAIQTGDLERALAVLADPADGDVTLLPPRPVGPDGRLHGPLRDLVLEGYGAYLAALSAWPARPEAVGEALAELGRFRVLCAHRRGPAGVAALGAAVRETLTAAGRISPRGDYWPGRPLLVTRNDHALGVYNGDVGLVAPDPRAHRALRAFFPGPGGVPRAIAPPRLPPHETVFAMTVHKSQGSEFDAVAVVLPDASSPLLSRELLYTAVSRARRSVTLFAAPDALRVAIGRRAERAGGLGRRLWGA